MGDDRRVSGVSEPAGDVDDATWLAIDRLVARYADLVTRRCLDELDAIMAPTCTQVLDLGARTVELDSRSDIARFIAEAIDRFDFFELVPLNVVVRATDVAEEVAVRLYMVEVRHDADGRSDAFGVYDDIVGRDVDGRWRYRRRRYASAARSATGGAGNRLDVFGIPPLPAV